MLMSVRNVIAFLLILGSLACLYPGLTLPMMNINVSTVVPLLGRLELFDQTQSILDSIQSLYDSDHRLVAGLIFLFSIIVPVLKAVLLLTVLTFKQFPGRFYTYKFVEVIGKWSMADVFVVGIFMAFLASAGHPNVNATLFSGFNYFVAYCLISILGIQIMDVKIRDSAV